MSKKTTAIHASGDNVFADLGLPNSETHALKAKLVAELYRMTTERGLTQTKAGEVMGISQPEVSRLFRGSFREYSVDRLLGFLTAFDNDVEIVVQPRSSGSGRGRITVVPQNA